jgi:thioredoxin-related protein
VVLAALLVLLASVPAFTAGKPLKANEITAGAKLQATQQHKRIFLIFGASWCEDCHLLDAFLAAPEIRAILDKFYVISKITVAEENGGNPALNNPGGLELLAKFGGVGPGGVAGLPFIAILDEKGKLIVNSNPSVKGTQESGGIGYPAKPEEIDWFVTMLKKSSPTVSANDTQVVKSWLTKAANN